MFSRCFLARSRAAFASSAQLPRRFDLLPPPLRSSIFSRSVSTSNKNLVAGQAEGAKRTSEVNLNVEPLELFDYVDKDGNGVINREEFEAAVDAVSEKDLRYYAKASFRAIDANRDGTISREEFKDGLGLYSNDELRRLRSALSRNELSYTEEDASIDQVPRSLASALFSRFQNTFEVAVSKLLPGGFGWQYMSGVAAAAGFESTSSGFFLLTGLGDMGGVAIGHWLFCAIMKAFGRKVDLKAEAHTSLWLGSAAMCSGTAWQPVVNLLHDTAGLSFNHTLIGTGVLTGLCFFTGLRIGRIVYSRMGLTTAAPNYGNLKADALLSVSIGGATAAFVGTDVTFAAAASGTASDASTTAVADPNWLRPMLGIEDADAALTGCLKAGSSTALGFTVVQAVENVTLRPGANWVD